MRSKEPTNVTTYRLAERAVASRLTVTGVQPPYLVAEPRHVTMASALAVDALILARRGLTHTQIAAQLGISRRHVMRLLKSSNEERTQP